MRKARAERERDETFPLFDKDQDGKVTREEFDEEMKVEGEGASDTGFDYSSLAFTTADVDSDGALDIVEFSNVYHVENSPEMLTVAGKAILGHYDKDGDGLVSKEEFAEKGGKEADVDRHFKDLDKDNNGKLDPLELAPMVTGKLGADQDLEALLRLADTDGDGHLTSEELDGVSGTLGDLPAASHFHEWVEHPEL
eukprot:UN0679